MSSVFLDTVGLIALWDRADQWHGAATAAYAGIRSPATRFVTTTFVLLECGNAAARRTYRGQVDELRQALARRGNLIEPNVADWNEAWEQYARDAFGSAGIVDHVSFIVMRRLQISDAFTNDQHFRTAGLTTLF